MTGAFDVCGPLPAGVTVLEASAGTGKTFTIAALAARYVADGVPLDQLLLVTFTRMATGELRERVRERLVSAEHGLERALAGAVPEDDDLVRLLAAGDRDQVRTRRELLARALAGFDSATIATTHGFCQEVLGGLGIAGDVESDTTFVEDIADLREEVVDDLYVRRFHRDGMPQFGRAEAMEIARAAIENPAAPIEPADAPDDTIAAMRVRLAGAARRELDARKRRMAVMTYDDLLTRLSDTLAGEGGEAAAARLRARYRVVLVDEFQDTDPVQWRIMQTAFGGGEVTLILIGDPKQAIYAFRGADVYAYIDAARTAGARATLEVNWRSDQGLIDAYDALFGGARLGHEGIAYPAVRAAPANRRARLSGAPDPAPLRVRVVPRDAPTMGTTYRGYARLNLAREHVARDVAGDIVALLSSRAEIERHGRIRPGHVAVLVRTNKNAARVRDALDAVDVPAVINGAGSVFGTDPAREWLRLLEAIERPANPPRARSAALTTFLGWTTEAVAAAGEDDWEEAHQRLHHWARVLRAKGVASLTEAITLEERLPGRMLGAGRRGAPADRPAARRRAPARRRHDRADGSDRAHRLAAPARARGRAGQQRRGAQPPAGVRRRGGPGADGAPQQGTRVPGRLLPRPVGAVLDPEGPQQPGHVPRRRGHAHDRRRAGGPAVGRPRAPARRRAARRGPAAGLRRAHSRQAPGRRLVGRLVREPQLRARRACSSSATRRGTWPASGSFTPTDDAAIGPLRRARGRRAGLPERRASGLGPVGRRGSGEPAARPGALRGVVRARRSTGGGGAPPSATSRRAPTRRGSRASRRSRWSTTSPCRARPRGPAAPRTARCPSPLGGMPVGVEVGTLVHRVLESTDFAAADLDRELAARVAEAQARRRVELGDLDAVVAGLRAAIETPLGPAAGGVRLRDLARADRLDELDFELPLVGGDDPSGPALALAAIADVLRTHARPAIRSRATPSACSIPACARPCAASSPAASTSSLRLRGERFAVVDYKTNWLAPPGETLTTAHHRPAALGAEMLHSHYGLQAMLYAVALHRYLRWRLPDYAPQRNLAGVLYLFVRGMVGPDTPLVDGAPCGVFAWQPPAALVEALSDVLDRGAAA